MKKLRALVEEGGVVLVAFENEVLALPEMKARSKIFCDSADEERRVESGGMEDPGEHGSGRGLAVSSGDGQHFFAAQEFVMQQLGQRAEIDALVEHVLQFYVAAGHGIADHDQIGARFQISGIK